MIAESSMTPLTLQQRVEKELAPLDPKMILKMMSLFKIQGIVPGPSMVATLASAIIKCLKPQAPPTSPSFNDECISEAIRYIDRTIL